jgi:hypothetical protein
MHEIDETMAVTSSADLVFRGLRRVGNVCDFTGKSYLTLPANLTTIAPLLELNANVVPPEDRSEQNQNQFHVADWESEP